MEKIQVKVSRFDPAVDQAPRFQAYEVPITEGMSVMDVLDYIYQNLDGTLAYYDHAACKQGICARCTMIINGKASLACQTPAVEDLTLEPLPKFTVVRDLVYDRSKA